MRRVSWGWLGQRRVAAAVRCWCEQRRGISCGTYKDVDVEVEVDVEL